MEWLIEWLIVTVMMTLRPVFKSSLVLLSAVDGVIPIFTTVDIFSCHWNGVSVETRADNSPFADMLSIGKTGYWLMKFAKSAQKYTRFLNEARKRYFTW